MKNSAVILGFQVTEKGTELSAAQNKYFFKVDRKANKLEIRKAVEEMFNVTVTNVNTANFSGKKKRERTVNYGRTSNWKRAIISLKESDSIDLT
ncbi:MAG: 50S ribosomal protein L23 [Kiritimatiellia bacterium]